MKSEPIEMTYSECRLGKIYTNRGKSKRSKEYRKFDTLVDYTEFLSHFNNVLGGYRIKTAEDVQKLLLNGFNV